LRRLAGPEHAPTELNSRHDLFGKPAPTFLNHALEEFTEDHRRFIRDLEWRGKSALRSALRDLRLQRPAPL